MEKWKQETFCLNHLIFQYPVSSQDEETISSLCAGSDGHNMTKMQHLWVGHKAAIAGETERNKKWNFTLLRKDALNYVQ